MKKRENIQHTSIEFNRKCAIVIHYSQVPNINMDGFVFHAERTGHITSLYSPLRLALRPSGACS